MAPWWFIIVISLVVILAFVISAIRIWLNGKQKVLSAKIDNISLCGDLKDDTTIDCLRKQSDRYFENIAVDLDYNYSDQVISSLQEKRIKTHYAEIYKEAYSLYKRLEIIGIEPFEKIVRFIDDFGNIHGIIKKHNENVILAILEKYKEFFDSCLNYPLDRQQRRSIVSDADNCLVISSAGSGKTSSIIGKVKYLTEIKRVAPEKILLISYTNKAASELTDRMSTAGLVGYTFHKLAIDLIGKATGEKPSICDNTDALFVKIYRELLAESSFKKNVLEYFVDYQFQEDYWEQRKNKRRERLSEQKKARLKAVFPDMDGNPIYVRSEQEQKICFALSSLGIRFRYEEPYEYQLSDEMHSQYKPDFSIYYEKNGKSKRIYLEHFGVDEHGLVPLWFAKDRNITYEEANKLYNDGITWKRAAHEKFGTKLITTSSADFHYSDIKCKLKDLLGKAGVSVHEKTDAELYDSVLPKGSRYEKAFIRLVVTFVTLMKSSCKSLETILYEVKKVGDERSFFIIKNIFMPVYECYAKTLKENNQIDFTDAILWATDICRSSHPVEYDYIIVDEFQDISVDRYNFLKVLREGTSLSKLYCVGDDWQSIYRFSGSDMSLFNQFSDYFGETEINKIETTYRFGEPLVTLSSNFIQRNDSQIKKDIHPFSKQAKTELVFYFYDRQNYCNTIDWIISQIPLDKSVFLLGRYSFDDYYLSFKYQSMKRGNKFYYTIGGREIEFLTVHKSKGLEADYVILLQCNNDTYGFPSLVSDDPVLNYVLTKSDKYPFGEERRLFYVAITRAKIKTIVLYDNRFPSVFVNEFLHPEKVVDIENQLHPNANKRWTKSADAFLLKLHNDGKSIKYIAKKMGRSQTSIIMRLGKLQQ